MYAVSSEAATWAALPDGAVTVVDGVEVPVGATATAGFEDGAVADEGGGAAESLAAGDGWGGAGGCSSDFEQAVKSSATANTGTDSFKIALLFRMDIPPSELWRLQYKP